MKQADDSSPYKTNDPRRIEDLNAITTLKTRYTRYIDTKCWPELIELFSEDAIMQMGDDSASELHGREAILGLFSQSIGEVHTMHRIFPGEITFTGENSATAIWPMIDEVETRAFHLHGHGFYREEYRCIEGRWYIHHWRLLRVRLHWKPKSLQMRFATLLYKTGLLKLLAPDSARQFAQSFDPPLVRGAEHFLPGNVRDK